jgi:hypothetical protein
MRRVGWCQPEYPVLCLLGLLSYPENGGITLLRNFGILLSDYTASNRKIYYSSFPKIFLYVYPLIVARQRLGKNPPFIARQRLGRKVTSATNTYATIELLDASFSMWPVSYQGK